MNPCAGVTDLLVFEARPFSLLGTPAKQRLHYTIDVCIWQYLFFERIGTRMRNEEQKG